MLDDNRVSDVMAAQAVTDVRAAIVTIRTNMPFLISISQLDRKQIPKLGPKSLGFVEKALQYMKSNPEFLPGYVTQVEVDKDVALRVAVLQIALELKTLSDAVGDTLMVLGSEIWMACLAYYQSVREAARRKRPGAEVIYADLKVRFPGANPQEYPTPTPPSA